MWHKVDTIDGFEFLVLGSALSVDGGTITGYASDAVKDSSGTVLSDRSHVLIPLPNPTVLRLRIHCIPLICSQPVKYFCGFIQILVSPTCFLIPIVFITVPVPENRFHSFPDFPFSVP
jgi:hypothetical protein